METLILKEIEHITVLPFLPLITLSRTYSRIFYLVAKSYPKVVITKKDIHTLQLEQVYARN